MQWMDCVVVLFGGEWRGWHRVSVSMRCNTVWRKDECLCVSKRVHDTAPGTLTGDQLYYGRTVFYEGFEVEKRKRTSLLRAQCE